MITCQTIAALRAELAPHRAAGKRIAIVPTMGNLHIGHLKLVEAAHQYADIVVATIFVNPMQFGPNEDLEAYPRTQAEDQDKLTAAGTHVLFAPAAKEIYPQGLGGQTQVIVPDVTEELCGASRPGHFTGVTTVVTKLFNIVQPDVALFGKKDFQQLTAIRKMTADLCLPIEVIGVPTVRADDGLALSSRNGYLSASERAIAPRLNQVLREIEAAIRNGDQDYSALCQRGWQELESAGFRPDYLTVRNSQTLREATPEDRELVVLAAAYLGSARLIDNIPFTRDTTAS